MTKLVNKFSVFLLLLINNFIYFSMLFFVCLYVLNRNIGFTIWNIFVPSTTISQYLLTNSQKNGKKNSAKCQMVTGQSKIFSFISRIKCKRQFFFGLFAYTLSFVTIVPWPIFFSPLLFPFLFSNQILNLNQNSVIEFYFFVCW